MEIDHLLQDDPLEPLQTGTIVTRGPYTLVKNPDGTERFLVDPKTKEETEPFFSNLGRRILSRATATFARVRKSP